MRACSDASVVSNSMQTDGTVAHQAPLSMGFPRQEYWSGLSCPPPRDLPDTGIDGTRVSYASYLVGGSFTTSATWEAPLGWVSDPFKIYIVYVYGYC